LQTAVTACKGHYLIRTIFFTAMAQSVKSLSLSARMMVKCCRIILQEISFQKVTIGTVKWSRMLLSRSS